MSPLLYGQRRDENEREIVEALREFGAYVQYMDKSAGFDLLVGWQGVLNAVEVKRRGERMTERERETANDFQYHGLPYHIVRNLDDVITIFGG